LKSENHCEAADSLRTSATTDLPTARITPRAGFVDPDSALGAAAEERLGRSLTDKPTELTMKRYRLNACAILLGLGILALIEIADYFGFAR
jgi:hypothetical protein